MWKSLLLKIKNYGVSKAIDALDNLEQPLGERLELLRKQIEELDSQGFAKLLIDEIQTLLRQYFKIPEK